MKKLNDWKNCKKWMAAALLCILSMSGCSSGANAEQTEITKESITKEVKTEETTDQAAENRQGAAGAEASQAGTVKRDTEAFAGLYRTMEDYSGAIWIPETGSGYMQEDCYFLPGCTEADFKAFTEGLEAKKYQLYESADYEQAVGGTCLNENRMLQYLYLPEKTTLVMRMNEFGSLSAEQTAEQADRSVGKEEAMEQLSVEFAREQEETEKKNGKEEDSSRKLIPAGMFEAFIPDFYENTGIQTFLMLCYKGNAFYFEPYLVSEDGVLRFNGGFTDCFAEDADGDGTYELYNTIGWGFGLYRNMLAVFVPDLEKEADGGTDTKTAWEENKDRNGTLPGTLTVTTFVDEKQMKDIRFFKAEDGVHLGGGIYSGVSFQVETDYGRITRTDGSMFDEFLTEDFPFKKWEDLSYASSGSEGSEQAAQTLTVRIGGDEITAVCREDGEKQEQELSKLFADCLRENEKNVYQTNGQYENGEHKIVLDFGEDRPDKITVMDCLLTADGEEKYGRGSARQERTVLMNEEGLPEFGLCWHSADMLSSAIIDYTKPQYRGFIVTAEWDGESREFVFAAATEGECE